MIGRLFSGYLRICKNGGMSGQIADTYQSVVDHAESLGYFKSVGGFIPPLWTRSAPDDKVHKTDFAGLNYEVVETETGATATRNGEDLGTHINVKAAKSACSRDIASYISKYATVMSKQQAVEVLRENATYSSPDWDDNNRCEFFHMKETDGEYYLYDNETGVLLGKFSDGKQAYQRADNLHYERLDKCLNVFSKA